MECVNQQTASMKIIRKKKKKQRKINNLSIAAWYIQHKDKVYLLSTITLSIKILLRSKVNNNFQNKLIFLHLNQLPS
jgi:hypothetical protein